MLNGLYGYFGRDIQYETIKILKTNEIDKNIVYSELTEMDNGI